MKKRISILIVCGILALSIGNVEAKLNIGIVSAVKNKVKQLKNKKTEDIQYKLGPQTKILSAQTNSYFLSVSQDSTTYKYSLQSDQISTLQSGNIILSTQGEGILKKVVSVTNTGAEYEVLTETATLEEAYESLDINFSQSLIQDNLKPLGVKYLVKGVKYRPSEVSGEFPVDISSAVLYDADGDYNTTNDQVIANGNITFKITLDGKIVIKWFSLKEFKAIQKIEKTANLEIKSASNYAFDKKITLATFAFSSFAVGPVIFVPEVKVIVGGSAQVGFEVTTSIVQDATYTIGMHYLNGIWSPIREFTNDFQYNPPSLLTASGEIKGYAGPQANLMIYGILGPYINTQGYLNLKAESSPPDINWTLSGGLESAGGVEVDILSLYTLDYSATLLDWNTIIASGVIRVSNNSPTITSVVSNPSIIATGDVSVITCTAFDVDGDTLTYNWSAASGTISGSGSQINWTAPMVTSTYTINVAVTDGYGGSVQSSTNVVVNVSDSEAWSSVSSGYGHTIAIKRDGTLWAWGYNGCAQLGLGDTTYRNIPTQVGIETNWLSVSTGDLHSIAIKTDGTLWVWGYNRFGQLGLGDTTYRNIPTQVGIETNWLSVSAGSEYTIAIRTDGTLWSWGYNCNGELGLGDGGEGTDRYVPTQVGTESNWLSVSVGSDHTIAKKTDGTLWSWGGNFYGQLGLGDTVYRNIPTQIGAETNWSYISAGNRYTTVIKTNETLWSWGYNNYGQLGLGDKINRNIPTQVETETNWFSVSSNRYHTVAIKSDGTLWSWGTNGYGQLGLGDTTYRNIPTQVETETNWFSVSGDEYYTMAIKTDGTLLACGRNNYGQLGLGDNGNRWIPIEVGNNINHSPSIDSVVANPIIVSTGSISQITCNASDPEGDILTYAWSTSPSDGTISGTGHQINWTAPASTGTYTITAFVTDDYGSFVVLSTDVVVAVSGQNDAGSGDDAPDNFDSALLISQGDYSGYLDDSDSDDYYKFYVNSGQQISLTLTSPGSGDFDPYIYSPVDTVNWKARSYTTDSPESTSFVADTSGYWRVRINRYSGSGNYLFSVSVITILGTQKWTFLTGNQVNSSPAIGSDGTIYVGSNDGKLYAFNSDGTQKWSLSLGEAVESSPAIGSDGTIYVGVSDVSTWNGKVCAVNPSGSKKWEFLISAQVCSSPAIDSAGTVYVGAEDNNLYAINPDGTQKWAFSTGNIVTGSPAIGSDGTIYVGSSDFYFYAINMDGTMKWQVNIGQGGTPSIGSDGTIYVNGDSTLYSINPNGTIKWSFQNTDYASFSSPIIGFNGTLYAGTGTFGGKLYAINSNGTKKWEFQTGDSVFSVPAISSDGTIYIGSFDDKFYAINSDGTKKWEFLIGDPVKSSPTIGSDGTVYIGSLNNKFYAIYGSGTIANTPWPKFRHDLQNTGRMP